jgi:hypothetical protein
MSPKTQRWFALGVVAMAVANSVALAVLPAPGILAIHRTALNVFVQPGVIVSWLALAGPYQFSPATFAGYAANVVANICCWLLALWFMFKLANGAVTRRWYSVAAPVMAVASLAIMVMRESNRMVPSVVRDPLVKFVEPGVAVWWLAFGNMFQGSPSSRSGMALAALANSAFWLFIIWFLVAAVKFIRRKVSRPQP